jgi:hypothetical protein
VLNIEDLRLIASHKDRYQTQLQRLKRVKKQTTCIEAAVSSAVETLSGGTRSFVIYGEPQSGKTEMMICLTAKLLDDGHRVIVHLLNDSVQLLQQNLDRFQRSNLSPSAKNFSEVVDPDYSLKSGFHVIFCKKNASDLAKLNQKLEKIHAKVIIDDEADFATPNALINKGDVTKINALINKLISHDGIYIGVTATPARLDLNNTFDNDNEQWVNFPPHEAYTGQDVFFPLDGAVGYSLRTLPDTDDSPKYLRESIFRFLVRTAALNLSIGSDENFSMLIHTSGKKLDHKSDKKPIDDVMNALSDTHSKRFEDYTQEIRKIASVLYPQQADGILGYIVKNGDQTTTIIMNSERDKNVDLKSATTPSAIFTFVIGGNIVSRGVTFDNLLSMFFTRDSKHKIQQDTYIQRARMFGSRQRHLAYFELTIPKQLYLDWHRCFVFHKLALAAIKTKKGSPVWLADQRIASVASSSIDKANVLLDKGEMSFPIFDYAPDIEDILKGNDSVAALMKLQARIGADSLPQYLIDYVQRFLPNGRASIAMHASSTIEYMKDSATNQEKIERTKGLFGQVTRNHPNALHHFKIFFNAKHKARLIYKFAGNISFLKNQKNA